MTEAAILKPVVVNFSHPLSDLARRQIEEEIGEFEEIVVPVQVDMNHDLWPQFRHVYDQARDAARGRKVHAIIPPGLSILAYWLGMQIMCDYYDDSAELRPLLGAIWLRRVDGIPPTWELGGIG